MDVTAACIFEFDDDRLFCEKVYFDSPLCSANSAARLAEKKRGQTAFCAGEPMGTQQVTWDRP
jgi:hypothetical protein